MDDRDQPLLTEDRLNIVAGMVAGIRQPPPTCYEYRMDATVSIFGTTRRQIQAKLEQLDGRTIFGHDDEELCIIYLVDSDDRDTFQLTETGERTADVDYEEIPP